MKRLYNYRKTCMSLFLLASFWLAACGNKPSDQQILQDVQERLKAQQPSSSLTYTKVSADIKDGVITLNGQCEGERCADSAIALVREVKGVKEVVGRIQEMPSQTDYTLRTSVQAVISKYQGVQADVAGGVVVLRGSIKREQIQPLMNELSTLQARKIDNQLAIMQ
jgi:hyperosmotically inducible periplasmic protein